MDGKLKETIQKELKGMEVPESLYEFAYQVPDMVGKMPMQLPVTSKKRYRKTLYTSMAGVACAAMFMFSINISPIFAKYVEQIPILSEVTDYLKLDRGIEKAESNGVVQDVSMAVEDNGITFTIDKVISDSKRTVVYYEMELDSSSSVDLVDFNQYTIVDDNNQTVSELKRNQLTNEIVSFGSTDHNFRSRLITGGERIENDPTKFTGIAEFVNDDGTLGIPKELKVSIDSFRLVDYDGQEENIVKGNWEVNIPLDTKYLDAKPVEYEGKKFSIKAGEHDLDLVVNSVSVHPTITDMSMDLKNELDVAIFYEYHLENEDGKVYIHLQDGILTDTGDVLPQFESSYFDDSEKLYLVIDKVRIGTADFQETSYEIDQKIELKKK